MNAKDVIADCFNRNMDKDWLLDADRYEVADLFINALCENGFSVVKTEQNSDVVAKRSGAWAAFNHVLGWINTQTEQTINKKTIYAAIMDMRPEHCTDTNIAPESKYR